MLLADPIHLPALRQGVTTYIIGQDGSSFAPASPATIDYMRRYTAGFNGNPSEIDYDWWTIERVPRPLRPPDGPERGLPDPQRQRPDGGDGPRPAPGHRRRDPRDAGPGPPGDGRRRGRPLDRASTTSPAATPTPARSPRSARRSSPTTASTSPTCAATGPNAPVGMDEVYEIARASGVAAHISHYNGPADLLLPLIDQGSRHGPRPDLRHLSLPRRQHDPGHGRAAALGPGRGDRADARTAGRPRRPRPTEPRVVLEARPPIRSRRRRSR